MNREAFEAVGDHRARRAAGLEVRAEHEVIDHELRTAAKEVLQGCRSGISLKTVLLIYTYPGQGLAPFRQFVAATREFLLGLEQIEPGGEPFLPAASLVCHGEILGVGWIGVVSDACRG